MTLGGLNNASTGSFAAYGSSATNEVTVTVDGSVSNAGTLNIGAYSVFDVTGGAFTQTGGTTTVSANGFFSAPTIDIDGGTFVVDTTNFTNTGTLAAADGGYINLSAGGLTNLSDGTLTGGTYEVGAGSTLQLPNNSPIVDDDADIILSGADSTIEVDTSGTPESLDFTLRTISKGGQLHLLDWTGQSFTTAALFTNDGTIQLGGGRFVVTGLGSSLTDGKGSKLYGFGTVDATTFTNSGLVEASVSGKTLTLTHAVKGKGELQIDARATLVLAGTMATTNSVTFNGPGAELTLDHVGNLSGAIGGIGLDDTIGLVGVTANGASVNGSDQLVVTENGTVVDTLQLSGNNSGLYFLCVPVSGGTDIVSLPDPATVADYVYIPSDYDLIPGGFDISDTAANVVAALPTLNADSHVASITITSGSATLSGNVEVNAPAFTLTGSSTTLTLDENLTYGGSFSEGASDTFVLSGGNLLLTGADTFSGGTVDGSNLLETEGTTTISGLTIGGTVEWENTTTVTQSGGTGTIDDASRRRAIPRQHVDGNLRHRRRQRDQSGQLDGLVYRQRRPVREDGRYGNEHDRSGGDQYRNDRSHGREARFQRGDIRDRIGHNLGRIDPGIRLGGFEQHDGRLPEYRLHGRWHARSHRSHELLRRGFRLRGRRYGPASWLMGLFRFLREFGRHSGHADAREWHDHARFRLLRRLRAARFQNYLGSDLDYHPRVTQG